MPNPNGAPAPNDPQSMLAAFDQTRAQALASQMGGDPQAAMQILQMVDQATSMAEQSLGTTLNDLKAAAQGQSLDAAATGIPNQPVPQSAPTGPQAMAGGAPQDLLAGLV